MDYFDWGLIPARSIDKGVNLRSLLEIDRPVSY